MQQEKINDYIVSKKSTTMTPSMTSHLLTGGNESLQMLVIYPLLGVMLHRVGLLIHVALRQAKGKT